MPPYAALQLTLRAIGILLLITAGVLFLTDNQIAVGAVFGANLIFIISLPGAQYAFIVTRLAFALAAFTILLACTAWWRGNATAVEAIFGIVVFGYLAYVSLGAINATHPRRPDQPEDTPADPPHEK